MPELPAHPRVAIIGAGLGGTMAAYEIATACKGKAEITVIAERPAFVFTPSNPWVALGWREPEDIAVDLAPVFKRKHISFSTVGAKRLHPKQNRVELNDGSSIAYDYVVIATGPDLAFDEIEGLGPHNGGHTVSICQSGHAEEAAAAFDRFVTDPGPIIVGAVQGASCFVPKTGFMIESMATAIASNLTSLIERRLPVAEATWNAVCLADFGDGGVAFVAQPQIPPRNVNWALQGAWVHYAKAAFESYFLRKIRKGQSEPFYEKFALHAMGIDKLKAFDKAA